MARARTLWEEGTEPGRLVAALGIAIALTAVILDLAIHREITWLFDGAFVAACVIMALRVRLADSFTVGVLPPLMMLGIFCLLAFASPGVIADAGDGVVQAVVAGLAHHAGALITGYALCLGALAIRQHVFRKRRREAPRVKVPTPGPLGDQHPTSATRSTASTDHGSRTPSPSRYVSG
ncbi:DUF6542 domain-containing protein [Nocardioides jensenii]|uniref:DUF6542 domain-containing protein n=1 Tax=Nocardioides jensenii TaxID=1843 RepID=UPI000A8A7098|nr:DUF6542 domain-containing protein [Nocardioides jensenii]